MGNKVCKRKKKKNQKNINQKKKIKRKSSSSLYRNLRDYYRDVPERKNHIIIAHKHNFFTKSGKEKKN